MNLHCFKALEEGNMMRFLHKIHNRGRQIEGR